MSTGQLKLNLGGRIILSAKASTELWFNSLADGQRHTHLFNVGIYSRPDTHAGIYILSLTVLWLSMQIGISLNK